MVARPSVTTRVPGVRAVSTNKLLPCSPSMAKVFLRATSPSTTKTVARVPVMDAARSGNAVASRGWPTSMRASPVVFTGMRRSASERSTSTWTVRVSGSALGERRAMVPLTVTPVATTRMNTGVLGATPPKSSSGTSKVMRTMLRSMTVTSGVPGRTKAPGSMLREPTSPSKGARSTQSFTSRFVDVSLARCAASCDFSDELCAAFCSASFGETYPPSSSVSMRDDSCESACCRSSMARASAATAWLAALALRQSRVAITSPRLTLAPGRTSTVSTYAETNCGPTLASTHGRIVPMYVRVSRKLASRATMTVTGLGDEARATWFTRECARHMSPAPRSSTTATAASTTTGTHGDRVRCEGDVSTEESFWTLIQSPSAMVRPNCARVRATSNWPRASWISASVRTASASASSTALPMPARNRASAWS